MSVFEFSREEKPDERRRSRTGEIRPTERLYDEVFRFKFKAAPSRDAGEVSSRKTSSSLPLLGSNLGHTSLDDVLMNRETLFYIHTFFDIFLNLITKIKTVQGGNFSKISPKLNRK